MLCAVSRVLAPWDALCCVESAGTLGCFVLCRECWHLGMLCAVLRVLAPWDALTDCGCSVGPLRAFESLTMCQACVCAWGITFKDRRMNVFIIKISITNNCFFSSSSHLLIDN